MAAAGKPALSLWMLVAGLALIETQTLGKDVPVLHPVILVPGDGGSQLQARLNKPSVPHVYCNKRTQDWFSIWLNIKLMAPKAIQCTVDNLRLVYDQETHATSNSPGVEIRVPGFGETETVEWLTEKQIKPTAYFHTITDALVQMGYTRNVNIRGAPYDFRKAPNEMSEYFRAFKQLIEDTYRLNHNQRVILLAHSMGNPYTLYMLNQQTQAWKDQYIHAFTSIAGPYGGAAKLVKLMASGDDLDVVVVDPLIARIEQRSTPSSAWLMPYDTFWKPHEVILSSPTGNYTVNDYERFFSDISFTDGYSMRKDTENLICDLKAPGVEVFCIYGVNVPTPERFVYDNKREPWYDEQPTVITGDGDGTVNRRSAEGCLRWRSEQTQSVHREVVDGAEHIELLRHKQTIAYIQQMIVQVHRQTYGDNQLFDMV